MLDMRYIGNSEFELVFDSKKRIVLNGEEILEVLEQAQDALYKEGSNHGNVLHEQGTEQPLHKNK